MKTLVLFILLLVTMTIGAQTSVPLKITNGIATFESNVEVKGASAERIHKRTLDWMQKNFLAVPEITVNTTNRITANFTLVYSKDDWSESFKHTMQIAILETGAKLTITDTEMGLVSDGKWKKDLSDKQMMFEKTCNELSRSFSESLIKPASK